MQAITDECVNRLWWSVQSDSLTVIWCLRLLTLPPTVILPIAAFLSVTQSHAAAFTSLCTEVWQVSGLLIYLFILWGCRVIWEFLDLSHLRIQLLMCFLW